jgi:phage terminase large subunit GpA-like protein
VNAGLQLIGDVAPSLAPPPELTVSQWADANRFLPETSGARGARWMTDAVPYLRGVMDAVHEPGVKTIALKKAAQIGGSEAIHNILGYHIEYDPCPILMVHPSDSVAEEWSKERLADMIRTTPALDAVIRGRSTSHDDHKGESTLALKLFPGGFLALGGANTPNTFARRAARIAAGDDVDRWPAVVGEEGDPADLLTKRTTTFHDGIVLMVSTPTLKNGRIDTMFQRGDQRQYHLRCPRCGRQDWVTWSDAKHFHVAFEERDPDTARLACSSEQYGGCGARLDEVARRRMVAEGEWYPTADAQELGLVSFHLPAMVTTLGQASLVTWVSDWLAAIQKGKESTRVFINTTLAEGWEDRTAKMDPQSLFTRRASILGTRRRRCTTSCWRTNGGASMRPKATPGAPARRSSARSPRSGTASKRGRSRCGR